MLRSVTSRLTSIATQFVRSASVPVNSAPVTPVTAVTRVTSVTPLTRPPQTCAIWARCFSALSVKTQPLPAAAAPLIRQIPPLLFDSPTHASGNWEIVRFGSGGGNPRTYKRNARKRRLTHGYNKRLYTPGGRAVLWRKLIKRRLKLGS